MGTTKIDRGPTTDRVAENVKRIRMERRLTLDELAARLAELGRPISKSVLSSLERDHRRVDADDLVALALALDVTPNRLLLSDSVRGAIDLTARRTVGARMAWRWASGEAALPDSDVTVYEFRAENHPHSPPAMFTAEQWTTYQPYIDRLDKLRAEMREAGLDPRVLAPGQEVFEEHDESDAAHMTEHHHG